MSGKRNVDEAKEQRACYGRATAGLRAAHREEFDALLTEEYAKAGLEVRRRLSEEERAARAAAKAAEREARRAAKREALIASLRQQLEALEGGVPLTLADEG